MGRARFFFIEPSKVDKYHITLIEGYLRAISSSVEIGRTHELIACLSQSTFDNLTADLQRSIRHSRISVVSQDKKQLVRKTLLEFFVVMNCLLRSKRNDIVLISSIIPTSLILLELTNRILRRSVFVVMHGELEALFAARPKGIRTFSYWAHRWFAIRRSSSKIKLVVIAGFIKDKLHSAFPDKLPLDSVWVVPHPITATSPRTDPITETAPLCFIGHRTINKGFDCFLELSRRHPELRFIAIGGGLAEDVRTKANRSISGSADYLVEISKCSVAIFPYTSAYACSLSAAALDAISAGVHIVATSRGCFLSLAKSFGPDFVTIFESIDEIDSLLSNPQWLAMLRSQQLRRLDSLASSDYGPNAVRKSIERLIPAAV